MDKSNNMLDNWFIDNFPNYNRVNRLYHYTSIDTLEILTRRDGDFLLTYYENLNDYSEVKLGWSVLIECFQEVFPAFKEKGFRERLNRGFDDYICQKRYLMPWIASFSAERDSLYQWIAYTPRDVGGVSLSFDKRKLFAKVQNRNTGYGSFNWDEEFKPCVFLAPCLYLKQDIDIIVKFFKFLSGSYLEQAHSMCKTESGLWAAFFEVMLIGSAVIKHEAFHFEREWRVVFLLNQKRQLNQTFELNGKNRVSSALWGEGRSLGLDIREVMLSPHGDKKLLREKVSWIRDTRSLSYEISGSDAPYVG